MTTEFAQWYGDRYGVDPVQAPKYGPRRDPAYRSHGGQVAKIQQAMGKPPMHHQQYIADVATEHDEHGYKYKTVVLVLPRRAGKTTIAGGIQIHRIMTSLQTNVFYTAQTGKDARRRFKDLLQLWEVSPLAPFGKPRLAAGSEGLTMLKTGSAINVFAPTPTALHGDEGTLACVDEFWSLSEESGTTLQGNIAATQTTLGRHAQTWWFSTVGTLQSKFMLNMMERGQAGENARTCYIEYSMPDGLDPSDPASWAFHPALGHTITLDTLQDAYQEVAPAEFQRAYLNLVATTGEASIVPDWDTLPTDQAPPAPGSLALAYEVGIEGSYSCVVAAWYDEDDRPHVRVLRQAPGSWWLDDAVVGLADALEVPAEMIAADDGGPVRAVTDRLVTSGRLEPVTLNMAERAVADTNFLNAARDDRALVHDGTPALTSAIGLARLRTTNGVQTISRDKSAGPVPAAIAASVALHRAQHPQEAGIGVF